MLDDEGDPLIDEPETPTEKLRRLRYEAEELEAQLEADEAEKARTRQIHATSAGDSGEQQQHDDEYEQIDDLPRRDDADKTKPPPSRRRRKKAQADENGELSPAVLLKQLKRLRNGLGKMTVSEDDLKDDLTSNGVTNERKTKELLQKLGRIKAHTVDNEQNAIASTSHVSTSNANLSEFDARLDLLEKYVGTNEADVDEVCCTVC